MTPVFEVRHLTGPDDAPVVFDISLLCLRGKTSVVLGPIHAGKTMLMRSLLGLDRARTGEVFVEGERFDAAGESEERLRRLRTCVGSVFQGAALISRLGAIENVELPLLEHTSASASEAREAAAQLIHEVGLDIDPEATPGQLDRDEQRRLALARALALRPPVVILDEPTQGLHAHAAAELDETLARLQESHGFGTLILSHDPRYAFGRADRIYVLAGGRVVESGTPEHVRECGSDVVSRLLDRRGAA
ncbi:MAG TPA: ATP-binding cassette domain-containing protein [Gemmatimonadaceae bacterium]|nr:ATP-binding cassette domain-containing protein [Gemmatimonadaceae bacterium]